MVEDAAKRILITRRSQSVKSDCGGHVDLGEDLFDTAAREVKEEIQGTPETSAIDVTLVHANHDETTMFASELSSRIAEGTFFAMERWLIERNLE
ncbi:hypothetical protein GUITHDRAFT_106015 [Guillardia theta CCMP2712]|uniref:Nudix hydrolase domain-containing protein n=1 Tax=Guillardia theta (strain CCMP2712) TaxID=905079 RepID=L1JJZ2_GUITC|nr:hypothetical protein GUITHDRAFT_106015 [Guillardia theta CCMP2712]EKX48410.1 hypothetical protein GUITHDRAFT_106015 [Guillardia theta CCMP2712]|eukprot:XP_005835390.1 hypothetical protein GUITHDRAFT_106015 [Guillardia theta CCMP2712]